MNITNAIVGFLNNHFWALWWLVIIVYVLRNFTFVAAARGIGGRK